jgi:hypothetical protein
MGSFRGCLESPHVGLADDDPRSPPRGVCAVRARLARVWFRRSVRSFGARDGRARASQGYSGSASPQEPDPRRKPERFSVLLEAGNRERCSSVKIIVGHGSWRLPLISVVLVVLAGCSGPSRNRSGPERERSAMTSPPVQLVEASPGLRGQCQEAAAALGFGVPCPTSLPTVDGGLVDCRFHGCVAESGASGTIFFLNIEDFDAPSRYTGVGPSSGHLVVEGRRAASSPPRPCFDGRTIDSLDAGGRTAQVFECPGPSVRAEAEARHGEGAHTGHLLLAWSEGEINYAVSAHGHNDANRRLLVKLVKSIDVVFASMS